MGVPKRRTSKSRLRSRKSSHRRKMVATAPCPACGKPRRPHRVCPACGHYRDRQVVTIETK